MKRQVQPSHISTPAFLVCLRPRLKLLIFFPLLCLLLLPGRAKATLSGANTSCQQAMPIAKQLLKGAEADRKYDRQRARQAALLLEKHAPPTFRTADCPMLLAEAWYRSADPDADIKQTYPIFQKVRKYAEKALAIDPKRTEAHYWIGLAKLRKAQKVGGIRAFFIVWSGINELEKVRTERPDYDQAGAARVLSLLYRVAPQWTPFGNMNKAIRYGLDAVRASEGYPLNRLYLARAYLGAEKISAAAGELRKILAMGPNPFAAEARRQLAELGQPVL
jgi:tetratricopeptide (TPR) repeat protein